MDKMFLELYLRKIGFERRHLFAQKTDIAKVIWDEASTFLSKSSLYVHGATGTGKTHLMSALCREWLDQNGERLEKLETWEMDAWCDIKLITTSDLFTDLRRAVSQGSDSIQITDRLRQVPCLILDDIGPEQSTPYALGELYGLIDWRYRKLKWTCLTSNLSLRELGMKLGDRIVSRLVEMCQVIELKGGDRRVY